MRGRLAAGTSRRVNDSFDAHQPSTNLLKLSPVELLRKIRARRTIGRRRWSTLRSTSLSTTMGSAPSPRTRPRLTHLRCCAGALSSSPLALDPHHARWTTRPLRRSPMGSTCRTTSVASPASASRVRSRVRLHGRCRDRAIADEGRNAQGCSSTWSVAGRLFQRGEELMRASSTFRESQVRLGLFWNRSCGRGTGLDGLGRPRHVRWQA